MGRKSGDVGERKRLFADKQRVVASYNPKRRGKIVQAGNEVSEVKWDDGRVEYESNKYLKLEGKSS